MKASDSPFDEAHCDILVCAATFSTTAGTVASCRTVRSGSIAAMTAAI
jgi:hypothetical protein